MAQQLQILNSKERKEFHRLLSEYYGVDEVLDGALLRNEKKEKLYLFSKDLAHFDTEGLNIDAMGVYIGALARGRLRLTIEGSQLIGPKATKNTLALNKEETDAWLAGGNIPIDILEADVSEIPDGTFLLIHNGNDWIGCGRKSDQFIYNYVPKTRHTHASFDPNAGEKAEETDDDTATSDQTDEE